MTRERLGHLGRLLSAVMDPIGPHPAPPAGAAHRPAAVLFALTVDDDGLQAVLTLRNAALRSHPGQISFPGGRMEPGDHDVAATALRETHEEIGVTPADVAVLGSLPPCLTATGFSIVPVLGLLPPRYAYRPDPREVAEVFHVPVGHLLDPANHARRTREFEGRWYDSYEIDYRGRHIWGATAGMIVDFHRRLAARDGDPPHEDLVGQLRRFIK